MNLKRIILLLTVAFSLTAQGQRFDWVVTFTGSGATNRIVGSCVDSEGNYYFIGECSPRTQLCGVRILPDSVITTPLRSAVVIAKISPQGTLLWHKAIYNSETGAYTRGLRQMGDTSFIVQSYFGLPYEVFAYNQRYYRDLYYLDTLLPGNNHYPMPLDSVALQKTSAYITFRNDGSVIEQHFICVGGVDSTGHTLTARYMGMNDFVRIDGMYNDHMNDLAFDIDSTGNIYVLRRTIDRVYNPGVQEWSITDGTISALKILVDGVHPLYCPTQRSSMWNYQILKFSPHFDSILASAYMFDSSYNYASVTLNLFTMETDSRGNTYITMYGQRSNSNRPWIARVANNDSLIIDNQTDLYPTWLIRYNSNLRPTGVIQLKSAENFPPCHKILYSYVDETTNSLYISGNTKWASTDSPTAGMIFQHDTIPINNQSGFWIRADKDNFNLISSWTAQASGTDWNLTGNPVLSTYKNRVFAETGLDGGVDFADTIVHATGTMDHTFMVWSNDDRELSINSRGCSESQFTANAPLVVDSIVYLSGTLNSTARWGTITTNSVGASYAYIAKYVDPAFMTPYVDREVQEQSISWQQELSFPLSDDPVQLTATSTSGLPVTYRCNDPSIALIVGSTLYLRGVGDATVTASQNGNSQYRPATPVVKPLHVGHAGIDAGDSQGFAIYPNPAHNAVRYSTNEPVKSIQVISSQGRTMEVSFTGNLVDITSLPAGVYYLRFVTESNVYSHKIIKM